MNILLAQIYSNITSYEINKFFILNIWFLCVLDYHNMQKKLKVHFNNDMLEVQIWAPLKNHMMWFSLNYLLPFPHNVFSLNYWKNNVYNSLLKDFSSIFIRSPLEVMSSLIFYML
jgi:hypothetical protein